MLFPREMLARCAKNYPNKVAYICGEQRRTWREMDLEADRLARVLQKLGVERGTTVAILGHESLIVYEHFFACMKLGAIRLGLNWRYSSEELGHLIADSGVKVMLVDAHCATQLPELQPVLDAANVSVIGYGRDHSCRLDYGMLMAEESTGMPVVWPQVGLEDPLMLTYTSGTTGRPKGVLHKQSSIAAMILQQLVARGLGPDDVWYTAAASSWMTVVLNLLGLGNGMTHIISDGVFEIRKFLKDVERNRATAIMLVPTLIQRALDEVDSSSYDLTSVRLLMYGSAPASPQLIRAAYKAFKCEMVQSYGMTEAGWNTQLGAADHRHAIENEPGLLRSAGRAGVMSEIQIRSDAGKAVETGVQGNVWIRSETLMKGYLNRPEETAEALHGDWLFTNDIGYLDARGYLFLTDRRKFMIISGAVNIFPSSVENALHAHPSVSEAVVVGAAHPQWGEAVVAVVRVREGQITSAEQLLVHCERLLNGMERPKHFFFVDEYPRNINGKVQKQEVKKWVASQSDALPWNNTSSPQPRAAEPQT